MDKMVFLDLETSGLDPNYHEPIEVAWVDLTGEERFCFSLPFDMGKADEEALQVNGWGERPFPHELSHVVACVTMEEQLKNATIVANNVAFDVAFLAAFMRRHGHEPPWDYKSIDLKSLVAGRLGVSPQLVSTTKIEEHYKIAPMDKHTALGDAEWNREVYKRLTLYGS